MADVLYYRDLELPKQASLPPFKPPPRFGKTYFSDFDPQHPTQETAVTQVQDFAKTPVSSQQSGRWFWQSKPQPGEGLYLDGGFGVGKTHLLASAYHAADYEHKAYLSFQELVFTIGFLGMERAKEELAHYQLYCIDEFELDDPGNTLIVKTFLAEVFKRGQHVLTTSNTPPEAQGQGRFNARDFQREIQSIAERFTVLRMEGPDYRKRHSLGSLLIDKVFEDSLEQEPMPSPKLVLTWEELLETLRNLHPIRFTALLNPIGSLYVRDAQTLDDQNDALRMAHFLDKVYDQGIGLRVAGEIAPIDIYHPSYRKGAFAKKYERSLSRLSELLEETFDH
ncbi:MAG: cell division protein ZapE [Deinococcota bacterium]